MQHGVYIIHVYPVTYGDCAMIRNELQIAPIQFGHMLVLGRYICKRGGHDFPGLVPIPQMP